MTSFWEWLGRVVMLVLAGMITLSIIGAIAAIPSGGIETRLGMEPQSWPKPRPSAPAPLPEAAEPQPEPAPPPQQPATAAAPSAEPVAVPRPPERPDAADWMESIAYALLALVGLFALGLVLLWRALGHWRRSADALEALAARKS